LKHNKDARPDINIIMKLNFQLLIHKNCSTNSTPNCNWLRNEARTRKWRKRPAFVCQSCYQNLLWLLSTRLEL